eukprot:Lankesteria_metandrocarpae@DN9150_c0_g1_i1.p1
MFEVVCSDILWNERHDWFVLELPPQLASSIRTENNGEATTEQPDSAALGSAVQDSAALCSAVQQQPVTTLGEVKCAFDSEADAENGCEVELVCCTEDITYKLSMAKQDVTMYFILPHCDVQSREHNPTTEDTILTLSTAAAECHIVNDDCNAQNSGENTFTDDNRQTVPSATTTTTTTTTT